MNFWQKLVSPLFKKAAEVVMRFAPRWKRFEFPPISPDKLIREGYKINSAVSACVTTLAFSFPEPPLAAGYEDVDGRFIPNYSHKIMELIRQPNQDMGEAELMQFAITYASIGGNAYFWKQRRVNGSVMALWPFSDLQIRPIPGETTSDGFVKEYEYTAGDGNYLMIPKKDIIHWKWMIDPLNPARGVGAIELSAREVDKDNEATAYIFSLLKNNGVPPIVITMAEGDEWTQEKADRLGAQWTQKYARGEGRGGAAFIEYGMKAEMMGFDLQKLAADALTDVSETRIAANFHVPPSVAGLNVGIKRSDYGDTAARKAFTEQTLMALWRSLASELLNGLKEDFGETKSNFKLQYVLEYVGALQELKKDQRTSVNELWKSGLVSRSDAKRMLGMKPNPGDDVYFISLASEFVPVGEAVQRSDLSNVPEGQRSKGAEGQKDRGAKARSGGQALQRIRLDVARRMTQAVDVYFSQLADRVVERAGSKSAKGAEVPNGQKVKAGDLLNNEDRNQLEAIIKRYYVEILKLSWDQWNYVLGVEKAFDLEDPLVGQLLKMAATNVKDIHATTLQEIRDALKYGNDNGWSIDQIVRGDAEHPGLRDIVDETYKGRASNIARTELGKAQNAATVSRYKEAGVKLVEILDNGNTDDDEECQIANGQIWTLDYFSSHPLEHPNCTRCSAPVFDDVAVDRG